MMADSLIEALVRHPRGMPQMRALCSPRLRLVSRAGDWADIAHRGQRTKLGVIWTSCWHRVATSKRL
jgi:hypothetical protein